MAEHDAGQVDADTCHGRDLVERFWRRMDAGEFVAAGELLHDDYRGDWPQSRERIRGRAHFVAINTHYPGRWRINLVRLLASGDQVATEVIMTNAATGHQDRAVSFFEVREGRIAREVDYWPDPYDAPAWRAQWVERIEED